MIKICFSGDFLKYLYHCQGHHLPWRNPSMLLKEECHSSVDSWQSMASVFHVSIFPGYAIYQPCVALPTSIETYSHGPRGLIGHLIGHSFSEAPTESLKDPNQRSKKRKKIHKERVRKQNLWYPFTHGSIYGYRMIESEKTRSVLAF